MKQLYILLLALLTGTSASAQTELTTSEAKSLYKTVSKKRVSVHDPSVVYDTISATKRYYIIGSHRGIAWSTDMQNWTGTSETFAKINDNGTVTNVTDSETDLKQVFRKHRVTKIKKGGQEVNFGNYDATDWVCAIPGKDDNGNEVEWGINGVMWAPDMVWNPVMQKWCQYLSLNGNGWNSAIVLLTADKLTGPWVYEGPVVYSGFLSSTEERINWKKTDLELVLGELSSVPSRYVHARTGNGQMWGDWWPNNIDPCVFYDEQGELWLAYGSWSGGIWMLKLNKENGLRDYDVTYQSDYNTKGKACTTDPYFGKRIAGGCYVSGEGPYIEHIGDYYYLFMSYGGFAPDGGYEMRVFRSKNPDGPYVDSQNRSAQFTSWALNYGKNATDNRGEKVMGAYNDWGFMTVGECAQGHNSVIAAPDGRTYLVYHTKFNNGTLGHQVRVHQMFLNKNQWPVVAPYEYNGEQIIDADMKQPMSLTNKDIIGTYQLLVHKYRLDHNNMEEVTPVTISLNADGTITGSKTGTWSIDEGTHYITLNMSNSIYYGVVYEETMDYTNMHAVAITAVSNGGVSAWAYKYHPKYELAYQIKNQKLPVVTNQGIKKNIDLYGSMPLYGDQTHLEWSSSHPTIINDYGKYYPIGLEEDTEVTLTARLTCANYFWQESYPVKAMSEANAKYDTETWANGLIAHYDFDSEELTNKVNTTEKAQLKKNSTAALPTIDNTEKLRNGNTVHLNFGANGKESYVAIPNPLKGKELNNGATISFFVKRTDENLWDALLGMSDGTQRLYMTGNLYVGFNNGNGNYIDINHPETVKTGKLVPGKWDLVTITFSRTVNSTSGGITIYINGAKNTDKYKESLNGKEATTKVGFDYNLILDLMASCDELWLGNGSFWGSADVRFDDVMIYDRSLSLLEIIALNQMTDRGDTDGVTDGIKDITKSQKPTTNYFDLQGRSVMNPRNGLYIRNGKKILVR